MNDDAPAIYGLVAEFDAPEALVAAAARAHAMGYRRMDAYSAFPVEGLPEALGLRGNLVPAIVLAGGVLGALGGYLLQWWASTTAYPLNVGGRPLHSWPAFIPVTFETTVLTAAVLGVIGMLALNRLPLLHHPVFDAPGFERATRDGFFLAIEADDPLFDLERTRAFLTGLGAAHVVEAPA